MAPVNWLNKTPVSLQIDAINCAEVEPTTIRESKDTKKKE